METVDEELKPETVETLDLRGDIGFLLKDEVEAIDGYDKVLSRAELTEEQKNTLEEIRNDELDHVNKLNEIYRTLATGDIEEDNDLIEYNKDSAIRDGIILVKYLGKDNKEHIWKTLAGSKDEAAMKFETVNHKFGLRKDDIIDIMDSEIEDIHNEIADSVAYTIFGDVFEPDANGMKVNGKYFTKEKMEEIYNKYQNVNIMNRPSAILFYQAYFKKNYPINNFKKIGDSYRVDDSIRDTRYIIQHKDNPNSTVGEDGAFHFGGVRGAKRYNTRQEAEEHANAMSSDWRNLYNIVEVKDGITGAKYKEANVNEPLNPMCDEEVEDGFLDNILSKGLDVVSSMANKLDENTVEQKDSAEKVEEIMEEAKEVHERLKDTDTVNDIGLIEVGNQYRWEEKYGNALLTVMKTDTEIRLALDRNGAYVEIPREKFEEMVRSGKLKAVESVNIDKYSDVKTVKAYKVKVGDRTFIVSAASPKDAKNKVKAKMEE